MDYSTEIQKRFFQMQRDVDRLSERDRGLLLFVVIVIVFAVWFFIPNYIQSSLLQATQKQIRSVNEQSGAILDKKTQIENLINTPDIQTLMQKHKNLLVEMASLDQKELSYTHRYISSKDLAKLLHDMTNKTDGVKIVDFSTAANALTPTAQAPAPAPAASGGETPKADAGAVEDYESEKTHYRLVLKGGYFAIISYLKRLEELTWRLYWDQFEYSVINYPQGLATISFYTLKPAPALPEAQQGGKQ